MIPATSLSTLEQKKYDLFMLLVQTNASFKLFFTTAFTNDVDELIRTRKLISDLRRNTLKNLTMDEAVAAQERASGRGPLGPDRSKMKWHTTEDATNYKEVLEWESRMLTCCRENWLPVPVTSLSGTTSDGPYIAQLEHISVQLLTIPEIIRGMGREQEGRGKNLRWDECGGCFAVEEGSIVFQIAQPFLHVVNSLQCRNF